MAKAKQKAGKVDLQEQFIELRASGLSYTKISRKLNVSKPTLIAWSKDLKWEISNAHALRMDALFERFAVSTEKRIKVFGKRLEAILKELDKRDLSKVRTEALLTLALKYGEWLRSEYIPLVLREEQVYGSCFIPTLTDEWQG